MNHPCLPEAPIDALLPDDLLLKEPFPENALPDKNDLLSRVILGAGMVCALQLTIPPANAQGTPEGITSDWKRPELRLIRRMTMGLTVTEASLAGKLGFQLYLERQLNDAAIDDSRVDRYIAQTYPMLTLPPVELVSLYSKPQLIQAALYRALFSQKQLRERMVEFWTDHFNINIQKVSWLKVVDDREVIRPYAMDKFPTLLRASAHSPAMLNYLDTASSRKERPNQNYARELLELHTMGAEGGFTQQDVEEVARCFTGWTYGTNVQRPDFCKFVFNPFLHDNGQKVVLGQVISAGGGQNDGETVLNLLATHPQTARFIATKMLRWLLMEDPPKALISRVARVYQKTDGDIKSMIRAILTPKLLLGAPAKFKRPYHLVTSTLRATSATVLESTDPYGSLMRLQQSIEMMGQPPFQWAAPNGFPDTLEYWAGIILPRLNFGADVLTHGIANVKIDVALLLSARSSTEAVQLINNALFAGEMSLSLTSRLNQYLTQNPSSDARISALGLALASPDFQWY